VYQIDQQILLIIEVLFKEVHHLEVYRTGQQTQVILIEVLYKGEQTVEQEEVFLLLQDLQQLSVHNDQLQLIEM
jgi:hypothetical protein